jgi:hypothetical protein
MKQSHAMILLTYVSPMGGGGEENKKTKNPGRKQGGHLFIYRKGKTIFTKMESHHNP